jgi:hypothetical protein
VSIFLPIQDHSRRSALVAHSLRIRFMIFAFKVYFVACGLVKGAVLALLMRSVKLGTLFALLNQITIKCNVLELSAEIIFIACGLLVWFYRLGFVFFFLFGRRSIFSRLTRGINLAGAIFVYNLLLCFLGLN